jgi:hypothetical protein
MTLLNPSAFYLLFASLLVLLLHLLRARERRRDVSALFLWEGLPGDPQSRAARIRQQLDPLVLLQLAALLALVAALAQPAWRVRTAALSGLALVLDGSASMRTADDAGSTRYERAVEEALKILDQYPSADTAVVQLTSDPTILARPDQGHSNLAEILHGSEPTWRGDGTADALLALLGSLGGTSRFERVFVLTDHAVHDMPPSFDTLVIGGEENLALTGFSIRENPNGNGVSALVSTLNDSAAYQDVTIRIDDRENQTTLTVLTEPGAAETFVIPFPNSTGTLFTASLEPTDAFPADNRRFFSLDRAIDIRIHWLGPENRYLSAALGAVAPIRLVDSPAEADLIVVHAARAPASLTGTILLMHGDIDGLLTQGEMQPTEQIEVVQADHPLLHGVDATTFRVREAPTASLPSAATIVLRSNEVPLLAAVDEPERTVIYLAPDILDTNLPITIDFPLLIRNVVSGLVRLPSELSYRSADVGEPVSLAGRGTIEALYDADEERIELPTGLSTFRPTSPGFHTLVTDRGAFAIAVNVPTEESAAPASVVEAAAPDVTLQSAVDYTPLWPYAAALAILLLLAEAYVHAGRRRLMGRAQ